MAYNAKDVCRNYVNSFSLAGAGWALVPIPGHSLVLTIAEAAMLRNIAKIYGLNLKGVIGVLIFKAIMLKIGGSMVLKALSEFLTVIPVIGWLAKPAVAGAAIKGFGEAAIAYLDDKFPNHIANTKPSYATLIQVFGNQFTSNEIKQYYESYTVDTINTEEE